MTVNELEQLIIAAMDNDRDVFEAVWGDNGEGVEMIDTEGRIFHVSVEEKT